MTSLTKPKRALLAYCALADRLHQSNPNLLQVLTPFFAPVCGALANELFDAGKFSDAVFDRYGLRVPRLAVLGLAEQLEQDGLLISMAGRASRPVYQYANVKDGVAEDVPPVSEAEVDQVLVEFAAVCRQDPLLSAETDPTLHEAFLDRLLQTDSMRLLSRREGSGATKKGANTLTLKGATPDQDDRRGLRLDFHVAQYLLDLRDKRPDLFNRVSDIAFANMAAEALACFSEPVEGVASLNGLTVYLDSPLLLDVLGINADYTEYGLELLQMIQTSGATAAVFDDCIAEAESVIAAQHAALRTGVAQRSSQWGTTAKPHVLMALMNNVGDRAIKKGVDVHRDPEVDLIRKAKGSVGDIQAEMTKRMQGWPTPEARQHDERSVWSMLRIRDSSIVCRKVSDSKTIFIARNTGLVRIANDAWRLWLQGSARHSQHVIDRWSPVAMSDKQLAGYLWLRRGACNGQMSKSRLLAHCSAAIRPRPDVKAKAYNLVLELHGKDEAEHIAALLEDRDGERALMRATRADPEDVTKERLPFILEQVRLAAGEFAAAEARAEAREELDAVKQAHEAELERLRIEVAADRKLVEDHAKGVADALVQESHDRGLLQGQVVSMAAKIAAAERVQKQNEVDQLTRIFASAQASHRRMRWELVALFAVTSLCVTTSASDWEPSLQILCTLLLSAVGFWFVPEFLEGLVARHSRWLLASTAVRQDIQALLPTPGPDFKSGTWPGLNALKANLMISSPSGTQRESLE